MESGLTEEELELLEPHPDIHALFVHYNSLYFDDRLGACSVEWSSARMTLCGGVCEFRPGGGCRIKLSEPLLKLRPPSDLKVVLLHEMIHASMMLQGIRDDDPGGHGTIFRSIMAGINASTLPDHQRPPGGYNITTTHSMFAEVDFYRQHHWRCERCGNVIKRAMNRPPQEADCRLHVKGRDCGDTTCQYHLHLRHCGGQWIKIKEPEGYGDRQRRKGRNAGGNGGSAEQGGSASGGGEARADGAPVPAKRPKKAGGIGSGGRPITDFFPSAGPSSPPMSTSQGSSERGANPSVGAAAAAAAASGRAGGVAVLPAIQEVQQAQHAQRTEERHSYQQQQQLGGQQEQQAPQQACRQQLQAEPPPEERRRLLAEAALRRLQRVQEPVALLPQQQPMEQQRQAEQQLQVGQLPAPPTRQQRQRQVPEGASLPAGSPGFVDLAGSDGEGGGLPRRMPQHWQQQQQGARGATSWAADGTAASSARGARMRVVGSSPVPRAAASAAGSAPKELAVGDAGAGAACPVCGKRWPPAAELGSAALNAELNAHIDECLTLSALAE